MAHADLSHAPSLSLLVLESADIEAARNFYGLLGLSFVQEQHGKGPIHFAAPLGPLILEIYPSKPGSAIAPLRLGFKVSNLDETLARLRDHGARLVSEPKDSAWGRRAVVEDPDGNRIELTAM